MSGALRNRRGACLSVLAALLLLGLASGALAYFLSSGTGAASASVGSVEAPSGVSAQQSGADVTVSWNSASLSSGGSVQGYSVKRSDGTSVCGSPTLVTTLACTDQSVPAGSYSYTVTAVYNTFTAQASSGSITILTAPSISSEPSDPSANAGPSFAFSGGASSSYECQLDSGGYSVCTSPASYSGLADSHHTFQVRDINGRSSGPAASYTWTVDTSAPSITAKPTNPSNDAAPSFSFSHTESGYTFSCQLDSGGFSACTSPRAYSGLADGSHTFAVKAVSADGAATSVASYTWTLDTTPPATTITLSPSSPNGSAGWYTSAPSFTLSASDAGSGVAATYYQVDAGTTLTYTGTPVVVPEGQHTITYWSTDNAGNSETHHTTATIKVDTTAPRNSLLLAGGLVWANNSSGTIGRANIDGTGVNQSLIAGASSPALPAVDGSYIYWANQSTGDIGRARLDGSGVQQNFITGGSNPIGVAVDGNHIYWANNWSGSIGRANLNGTGIDQSFITGADYPIGVAVDASHVYWTNNGSATIGRANIDGSSPVENFISGAIGPAGVAVDSNFVYWSNNSGTTIGRARLDGSFPDESFITGASAPEGVAVDGSYVYWANRGSTTIGRSRLDGSSAVQNFISGASGPDGVAVMPTPSAAFLNGSTLYYNGAIAGSFNLTTDVTDWGSGPASTTFPGTSATGWTHAAETVTSGSGAAPYVDYTSSTFSWSANPSNPSGYTITSSDVAGNTASTPVTFVSDTTAPDGGALSVNGIAATSAGSTSSTASTSFPIDSRTDYADSQSGLKSSTLTVQSETLSSTGVCGSPGSGGPFTIPTSVTGTTQPSGIATGYCYRYTLTGTDNVGNSASISTTVQIVTVSACQSSTMSGPAGIAVGGDGALWFTNHTSSSIGRTTTNCGVTNYTAASGTIDLPIGITAGPASDGGVWFASTGNDAIGRVDLTTGAITTYSGYGVGEPWTIVSGPDGALWFTNYGGNSIGRITTSGAISYYTGAGISYPRGITVGPDGALWFTNFGNNSIGRLDPSTGAVSNYTDPAGTINEPAGIVTGPDNALWFTNYGNHSIGRITTSGTVSNYTGPGVGYSQSIAVGPDGALWFTNSGSIGRITTSGAVSRYTSNYISDPTGIVAGPDGAMWFSDAGTNSIGRITVP